MKIKLQNIFELGYQLALRDFSSLYRLSFLGVFWGVASPLVTSLSFILLQRSNIINIPEISNSYPAYDISGTFYDVGSGVAYIRVEGFFKSVKYRVDRLIREFSDFEVDILEMEESKKFWQNVNDLEFFVNRGSQEFEVLNFRNKY